MEVEFFFKDPAGVPSPDQLRPLELARRLATLSASRLQMGIPAFEVPLPVGHKFLWPLELRRSSSDDGSGNRGSDYCVREWICVLAWRAIRSFTHSLFLRVRT